MLEITNHTIVCPQKLPKSAIFPQNIPILQNPSVSSNMLYYYHAVIIIAGIGLQQKGLVFVAGKNLPRTLQVHRLITCIVQAQGNLV